MAIYGYERDGDEMSRPMILSEVTFSFDPEDLRRVAHFLSDRADEIEAGAFTDGGRHLCHYDQLWNATDDGDVIVVPPRPAAPSGQ